MRMFPLLIALAPLAGACNDSHPTASAKAIDPPAPPRPAPAPVPAPTPATPTPATPASATVPAAAPDLPASAYFCCCSSLGDVHHDTLENDAATCRDELHGECVEYAACGLTGTPRVMAADRPAILGLGSTASLMTIWRPRSDELVALGLTTKGNHVVVRARVDETWRTVGKVAVDPVAGRTLSLTPQPDGSIKIASGASTWALQQPNPHDKVLLVPKP